MMVEKEGDKFAKEVSGSMKGRSLRGMVAREASSCPKRRIPRKMVAQGTS
ncbi:hypothetical protein KIS4809_5415 [Bacillus sp. ZZV12-4809]|nr:hypothetical protein KIS4809_5415 [Bacillus sp. ZZV12-4809]